MAAAQGGVGAAAPGASHALRRSDGGASTRGDPPPRRSGAIATAYDAWRANDHQTCIDRFGQFLQSFPTSQYADDAAFWLADCYFKQGDLQDRDAALRRRRPRAIPKSEKASEALYRQGEALLKLGPELRKGGREGLRARGEGISRLAARSTRREQQLKLLGAG